MRMKYLFLVPKKNKRKKKKKTLHNEAVKSENLHIEPMVMTVERREFSSGNLGP